MRRLMLNLWNDDCGALIATEWVFVATIMVLGIITGLVAIRQAVITELETFANAIMGLNVSFSFSGQTNCQSSTAGSDVFDSANQHIPIFGVTANFTNDVTGNPCD